MPSDTPEVLEKLKLIGRTVRINNGHRATVMLTDYRESSDDYDGLLIRNYSMNTDSTRPANDDKLPHFESVHGLTRYPNEKRPTEIMQFVFPGEDEEPLRLINDGNLPPGYLEMVEERKKHFGPGAEDPAEFVPPQPEPKVAPEPRFDPADKNQDHIVTKKERRQFEKEHGE